MMKNCTNCNKSFFLFLKLFIFVTTDLTSTNSEAGGCANNDANNSVCGIIEGFLWYLEISLS